MVDDGSLTHQLEYGRSMKPKQLFPEMQLTYVKKPKLLFCRRATGVEIDPRRTSKKQARNLAPVTPSDGFRCPIISVLVVVPP
jgi:hypothetical protein